MSFSTLGLSESLLKAVADEGYTTPSPIQAQAIPAVLEGRDVMAAAQTGTGKTASFVLPILEKNLLMRVGSLIHMNFFMHLVSFNYVRLMQS